MMEIENRIWPFTRPALMAGLRRYLADSSLRLLDIEPAELPATQPGVLLGTPGTALRAMTVGVRIDGDDYTLSLVLKEPPTGSGGRVLHAVGQREYGVYRRLAPHLPLLVPGLVAGDEDEGWVVLEALDGLRPPAEWQREDYEEALMNLVAMHDRFWGLGEDLAVFGWLSRSLDADYPYTVLAAAAAVRKLVMDEHQPLLSSVRYYQLFSRLTQAADDIMVPLRMQTYTLIHGDYWPGNIARPIDGRQIVFDWQRAGIGPAVLDLVGFITSTHMLFAPPMTTDEMISFYRTNLNERIPTGWDDERFAVLWDHAMLWLFTANELVKLAAMTPDAYQENHTRYAEVWLEPVLAAAERRLTKR